MKKILFIAAFALTSSLTFANGSVDTLKSKEVVTPAVKTQNSTDADEANRDCTVTVKGTFQGVEINVELTISDTSYLDCLGLKAKIKLLEAFYG